MPPRGKQTSRPNRSTGYLSGIWQQRNAESFTNSNELTFTGHPRKWRGGLYGTKAATIANFFSSQKVSQEQFCLNTCYYTRFLYLRSCHTLAQRPFWLRICLLWHSYTNTEIGFFRGFPGKQASAILKQSTRKEACLYNQNTGFGPC